MSSTLRALGFSALLSLLTQVIAAGTLPLTPEKLEVVNRSLDVEGTDILHLGAGDADGVAWLRDVAFTRGTLSVEVRGLDKPGESFVGLAFHGTADDTYGAVYLRPFNFNAADPQRRLRAVQYISHPAYPWQKLRAEAPGKYEAGIAPPPVAESWVRLTLKISDQDVRVFVNDASTPALSVQLLNQRPDGQRLDGRIGLWVGNLSEGWFRNLRVQPATAADSPTR